MLTLCLLTALAAPPVMQPIVPDGPVYLAQADTPAVAAPAETPTEADVPGLFAALAQAIRDKDWKLAVAFAVLLLVALANFILIKMNVLGDEKRKLALPWIAAATGCLVTFAAKLIAGGEWITAAIDGFGVGTSAIGLWELLIKHIVALLSKKTEAPKP